MRIDSTLTPWNPWTEINRAWNLMDRFLPTRDYELVSASFPIDMYQQDGKVIVKASIPGVKPEDLNVNLEQNVLTIAGETCNNFDESKEGGRVFYREHSYGKFLRSIRLPSGVDEGQIEAHLDAGILTVTVPFATAQTQQPKRIPIKTASGEQHPIETHAGGADRQKESTGHAERGRQTVNTR